MTAEEGCEKKDGLTLCFCNADLCNGEYTNQLELCGYSLQDTACQ